jgi:hypothetical protein
MIPPDYDGKKAAAELYGWRMCGYAADPEPNDTILLSRWEDKSGCVIEDPPIIVKADGGRFYDTANGQHQVFCRMPYYDPPEIWLLLLRVEELRKRRSR